MAAASVFNEQQFENKLVNLKDSQESINSLSSWCLQNRDHHKKIVNCWLHCLKRVKIEQRLSLFYLANDVIQYSKRKHYQFVESWGTALQKATTLVRDDKVKARVMRIFKIWDERGVYDEAFISDLCGLLTTNIKKKTETTSDPSEFQPQILVGKIRDCKNLEEDTDLRFRKVKENALQLTDADNMRTSLKDRRHGTDVVAEVDHGVKKMEAYVKALEVEIAEREKLIEILHQAASFYESQRGEAKIVSNAYRNFGNKVKLLKRKLDELIPTLSDSPIPSPDANAPSPSPDSDIELPNNDKPKQSYQPKQEFAENNGLDFSFMNTSFMGNSQFLDINLQRDVFNEGLDPTHMMHNNNNHNNNNNMHPLQNESNVVRPIEVISTREQKEDVSFNITDFIKSLLPTGVPKPEEAPDPLPPAQPLPPPPLPPFTGSEGFSGNWKPSWNQNDELQSGGSGGSWNHQASDPQEWNVPPPPAPWPERPPHSSDTPESPPLFEKEAVSEPVEYDDSMPAPPVPDVDHRTLLPLPQIRDMDHRLVQDMDHRIDVSRRMEVDHRKGPKMGPKDIDHRNLISLTGSPKKERKPLSPPPEFIWPGDQDYRSKATDVDFRVPQRPGDFSDVLNANFNPAQPPPKASNSDAERKDVNVESIDMDVSEEDEEEPNNLIQVEEDMAGSMDSSFLDQSNLGGFGMPPNFMGNSGADASNNQDVDERLKTIFGSVKQSAGAKLIPPNFEEDSLGTNDVPPEQEEGVNERENNSEDGENTMDKLEPNGFADDFLDGNDFFRREMPWQRDELLEQIPPQPSPNFIRGDFPGRMRWNSPRPIRGRGQPRFPFRPHHPRPDTMMRRMPFRPRMPVRGGRW